MSDRPIRIRTRRPRSFVARHPAAFWSSVGVAAAVLFTTVILLVASGDRARREAALQEAVEASWKSGWWEKGVDRDRVASILRICDGTSSTLAVSSTGAVGPVNMSYAEASRLAADNDEPVRRFGTQNRGRYDIGRLIDACEMRSSVYGLGGRFVLLPPGSGASGFTRLTATPGSGYERYDSRLGLGWYGR